MSCNHLSDCPRCGGIIDSLEKEIKLLTETILELNDENDILMEEINDLRQKLKLRVFRNDVLDEVDKIKDVCERLENLK